MKKDKVGIIDADLIGRTRHRFPNLVCMKISSYWKEQGADISLLMDYNSLDKYDHIYISKVFTDTPFPDNIRETERIHLGGTGFYFDKAPNLPHEIEHTMPDYHLYDEFVQQQIDAGAKRSEFSEYLDYSVGFLTRGCFRKCGFCVNQKYDHVFTHSPLAEFYDPTRKKICLLDDNFFGCPQWKPLLQELIETGKPFKFKQGLDERLLTDEKCEMLFNAKYDGDFTFAFDSIRDYDLIEKKLKMIRKYSDSNYIKFYVLCGYEGTGIEDIEHTLRRIALLMKYRCVPYIMRYQSENSAPWKTSEFRGMYITLARWCNQQHAFKRNSLRQYGDMCQRLLVTDKECAPKRYIREFEEKYPDIAAKYYDLRWQDFCL